MSSIPQCSKKCSTLRLAAPLTVMAAIYWFSAQPSSVFPHLGWWDVLWENGGHFAGYALLGAAWCFALGATRWKTAWGMSLLYALSDEFHQTFVPGRTADWRDVLVDALGAALAVYLAFRFAHSRE